MTTEEKWDAARKWEMEKFEKRKACPYGDVTFYGMPPVYCYVMHTLIIHDAYVMKDGLHPKVRKWIKSHYVDYEPTDWKTVCLIVS